MLGRLGYRPRGEGFAHDGGRRVIFLGDFVDRGPQVGRVLRIVRAMVDAGDAFAVIGNHEFNAIAYHTPDADRPGEFLRPHSRKNVEQHYETASQLGGEVGRWVDWFRTLPPTFDRDGVRAVHACWDEEAIAALDRALNRAVAGGGWTDAVMADAARPGGPLYAAADVVLKGREADLPPGVSYADKGGHERHRMRCKWYRRPTTATTFGEYSLSGQPLPCDATLTDGVVAAARPYPADGPPVFVGHYWLSGDRPAVLADNVACLDYSVAKRGMLCAYRWDGERQLSDEKFVTVPAVDAG